MKKKKINLDNRPPIKDAFKEPLTPGDIVIFSSWAKKLSPLEVGVYVSHFDNGSGWKMRIKGTGAENVLIHENTGVASGAIKVHNPEAYSHVNIVNTAINVRDNLIKNKKIKLCPKKKSVVTQVKQPEGNHEASDLLSSLGPPPGL